MPRPFVHKPAITSVDFVLGCLILGCIVAGPAGFFLSLLFQLGGR